MSSAGAFPDYTPIAYPRPEDVLLLSVFPRKPVFQIFSTYFEFLSEFLDKTRVGTMTSPTLVLVKFFREREPIVYVYVCV